MSLASKVGTGVVAVTLIGVLAGIVGVSVWVERGKYLDCRGAGHSIVFCVARSIW